MTETVPEEPSPLTAIPVNVPFVPPVPADLIFTMLIAPSTAADASYGAAAASPTMTCVRNDIHIHI